MGGVVTSTVLSYMRLILAPRRRGGESAHWKNSGEVAKNKMGTKEREKVGRLHEQAKKISRMSPWV